MEILAVGEVVYSPAIVQFCIATYTGKTEKERQLDDKRRGMGVREETNHTTARKAGPL